MIDYTLYLNCAQPYGIPAEPKTTVDGSTEYRSMVRRCNHNGQLADVGTIRRVVFSDKAQLKQMGIDSVTISKFKDEPRVISFEYPIVDHMGGQGWKNIAFKTGDKRIQDFFSMLKECKRINLKPNFDMIRIALRCIK